MVLWFLILIRFCLVCYTVKTDAKLGNSFVYFDWQVKDATRGVEWAAVPGAECMLLSSAGVFLRTAKSLTNFYGVAIIEDVQPGYYQVGAQTEPTVYRELASLT